MFDTEQRANERFRYETLISHECLENGISSRAKMYNFSRGGFYFESDIFLLPEEHIFIGIQKSPYAYNLNGYECHLVQVKWRKELHDSAYHYGYGVQHKIPVEYIAKATGTVHHDKKAEPVKVSKESRKHARIPYSNLIFFTLQNQYYEGSIRNISRGGVFIKTKSDLSVGQIIRIVIPGTKIDKGLMLRGKIVHITQDGIGVKFIGFLKDKTIKNHLTA